MEITFHLTGPADTRRLGFLLGRHCHGDLALALIGDLGAGKTCLTQGLARGLDVPEDEPVVSPSFTLANEYRGRMPLYHLDLYRLEGTEFLDTGLDEYFTRTGVTVVEWADKILDDLPSVRLEIEIAFDGRGRLAVVRSIGGELDALVDKVKQEWNDVLDFEDE